MYEGPGRYHHYKGDEYLVIGKGIREETKEENFVEEVIYRPLTPGSMLEVLGDVDFWSRTLADFNETVWLGEGKDATEVPRFSMIGSRAV